MQRNIRGRTDEGETPVMCAVTEVAHAKDVDARDLDPLSNVIDTDALNTLFEGVDGEIEVTFEYEGYTVIIRDGGQVVLDAL